MSASNPPRSGCTLALVACFLGSAAIVAWLIWAPTRPPQVHVQGVHPLFAAYAVDDPTQREADPRPEAGDEREHPGAEFAPSQRADRARRFRLRDPLQQIGDTAEFPAFVRAFHEQMCRCFPHELEKMSDFFRAANCELLLLGAPMTLFTALHDHRDFTPNLARLERFRAERCLRALASCDPLAHSACIHGERLPLGAACHSNGQCELGRCRRDGDAPVGVCAEPETLRKPCQHIGDCDDDRASPLHCVAGRCVGRPSVPGAECAYSCSHDLWCDRDARPPVCREPLGAGQPCRVADRFGLQCDVGLVCRATPTGTQCLPPAEAGETCLAHFGHAWMGSFADTYSPCRKGYACARIDGSTRRCLPFALMGAPCEVSDQCVGPDYATLGVQCIAEPGGDGIRRCRPPPQLGAACGDAELPCGAGAACDHAIDRCVEQLAVGAPCAATCGKDPEIVCVRGRCVANLPLGAPCVHPLEQEMRGQPSCAGALECIDGKCSALE